MFGSIGRHFHIGTLATGIVLGAVMGAFITLNPDAPTMFDPPATITTLEDVVVMDYPTSQTAQQIVLKAQVDAQERVEIARANAEATLIAENARQDELNIQQKLEFDLADLKAQRESYRQKDKAGHEELRRQVEGLVVVVK